MKKIVFPLIAISLLTAPAAARTSVQASDSRITYIGRTLQQDGSVSFDWMSIRSRRSPTRCFLFRSRVPITSTS